MADYVKPFLTKGKAVSISGELRQERWKDKNDKTVSRVIIYAKQIQLLSFDKKEETKEKSYTQEDIDNLNDMIEDKNDELYSNTDDDSIPF